LPKDGRNVENIGGSQNNQQNSQKTVRTDGGGRCGVLTFVTRGRFSFVFRQFLINLNLSSTGTFTSDIRDLKFTQPSLNITSAS
jgi:hypothetical protein